MIRSFAALAWNGFREARRNRVTLVVAAFALALLVTGMLLTSSTVAALERVLADVGLGAMSLALSLLAVFLSSGLLSREIERRTLCLRHHRGEEYDKGEPIERPHKNTPLR